MLLFIVIMLLTVYSSYGLIIEYLLEKHFQFSEDYPFIAEQSVASQQKAT